MFRGVISLPAAAVSVAVATLIAGGVAPAIADMPTAPAPPAVRDAGVQLAQGWGPPPRRGYYGPPPRRGYYGPPPRRGYYRPARRYGYRPAGVVSPFTVQLRLRARGYHFVRHVRYIPHGPRYRGRYGQFPGHYEAVATRLLFSYRFILNPYTGRPVARIRLN